MEKIVEAAESIGVALDGYEQGNRKTIDLVAVLRSVHAGLGVFVPALCEHPLMPGKIASTLGGNLNRLSRVVLEASNTIENLAFVVDNDPELMTRFYENAKKQSG